MPTLLIGYYYKLRALATLHQHQRRVTAVALAYGSVELLYRRDWLAVHLLDDVALVQAGFGRGRTLIDVGDHHALGPFRKLELLADIGGQRLDGNALHRALLATTGD